MCVYAEKVNSIVLTREDHGDKLFEIMGKTLEILLKSGYQCQVYADEPGLGIYVINYDYKNGELTNNELRWIDTEKHFIGDVVIGEEEEI